MSLFDYIALYPLEFLKYLGIGLGSIVLVVWAIRLVISLLKK